LWLVASAHVAIVFSESGFHTFNFIRMDTQRHLEEDEIENQLLWDTDSDCFNNGEDVHLIAAPKRKLKWGRATHYHHHSHLHHHRCGDHHSMTVGVRIIFPVEQRG
jgi:hypothetical protein